MLYESTFNDSTHSAESKHESAPRNQRFKLKLTVYRCSDLSEDLLVLKKVHLPMAIKTQRNVFQNTRKQA